MTTTEDDDKAPILPAMAIIVQLEDMIEAEKLISQRVAWKVMADKLKADEGVKTILALEKEVGQEIFAYAVRMVKTAMATALSEIPTFKQEGDDMISLRYALDAIGSIKIESPYPDDDR